MNNSVKKATALVLSASMLMSLTACGDKAKDQVIEAAGSVVDALTSKKAKNYTGLLNEDAKKYKDHVEAMEFFFEFLSEDIPDAQICNAILDSIEYEVDEKSVDASTKAASGSVDVIFTYADANKIAKDEDNITDVDTFVSAIKKAKETTEKTVTMEFELVDDEWLLSNFSAIEKFIEGMEVDVTFSAPIEDMIDVVEWWCLDEEDTKTYIDTSYIELDMIMKDEYYDVYIDYYFTVNYNGGLIYTSDVETDYGYMYCEYSNSNEGCPVGDDGWYMADGTYEISIYDANTDKVVASDTCTVVYNSVVETEATTAATTAAATAAASLDSIAGPALECYWDTEDAISAGETDVEEIYDEDSASYFYDADFYDSMLESGWWDYDETMTLDSNGYVAYNTDTVTMAYSVEVEQGTTGELYFEYYYSVGSEYQMIYSATISPTEYTNGTYYDIEFTNPDGFVPGAYTVIVTDASKTNMVIYADIEVVE